jgi:hypothetical protein
LRWLLAIRTAARRAHLERTRQRIALEHSGVAPRDRRHNPTRDDWYRGGQY